MTNDAADWPLLSGKVTIVGGGSSGIGRAVVECFARHGALVEFVAVDEKGVAETERDIAAMGLSARGSLVDASDPVAVKNFYLDFAQRHDGLDALVNSVGIQRYGTVETTSVETWDEVLAINLRSMFLMDKYAVPLLRERGGGAIVHVSSAQATASQQNVVAYTASKGAISAFTRAMAVDHAADSIRVNVVLPGSVDTPMLRASAQAIRPDDPDSAIAEWGRGHPIGRVALPGEVADACLFLVSSLASFVTGTELRVDGGVLAGVGLAAPVRADAVDGGRGHIKT